MLSRREEDLNRNMEDDIEDLTNLQDSSTNKWWWKEKDIVDFLDFNNIENVDIQFVKAGIEIGKLVGVKNRAYGNSFYDSGKILKILYPKGVSLEQMDDMLAIVRILDKLFRIASDKKALGESPYKDIAGYGILGDTREDNNGK